MNRRWALCLLPLMLACKRSGEEDLRKGNVFFAHQQWEQAEAHYRAALEVAPQSTMALEALGNIAYERGQTESAIEWYQKALQVDEAAISARHKLAVALLGSGRTEQAVSLLEQTIKLAPNDAFAYQVLGNAQQKQGNLQKAEALQRQALQVDGEYHAARYALANLLIDDGRLDEAERELERLLKRRQDALATYGYARLAAKRGDVAEVQAKLTQLLTLGASHPERILKDPVFAKAWSDPALAELQRRLQTTTSTPTGTSTRAGDRP